MAEILFDRRGHLAALHHECVVRFVENPACTEEFRCRRLPGSAFTRLGPIGSLRCKYDHERFEPDPSGIQSWTLFIPETDDGSSDIVAFTHGHCATLDGTAWALGGVDPLGPTRLLMTPYDWLRVGGDGLCIVNWHRAYWELHRREATLIVENQQQRSQAERLLAPPPRIKVIVSPRLHNSLVGSGRVVS